MSWLARSFRSHLPAALLEASVLAALFGLAATGVENVSSGHWHLGGEHAAHHSHLHHGSHEHPAPHDHDHAHDDHDHEAPDRPEHDGPRRTVTVSAALALCQPVAVSALAAPLADWTPFVLALVPPPAARLVVRSTPSRAPPSLSPAP